MIEWWKLSDYQAVDLKKEVRLSISSGWQLLFYLVKILTLQKHMFECIIALLSLIIYLT